MTRTRKRRTNESGCSTSGTVDVCQLVKNRGQDHPSTSTNRPGSDTEILVVERRSIDRQRGIKIDPDGIVVQQRRQATSTGK